MSISPGSDLSFHSILARLITTNQQLQLALSSQQTTGELQDLLADQRQLLGQLQQSEAPQPSNSTPELEQQAQALQTIVKGTASVTGAQFFPVLVESLVSALGVRNAIVSERIGDQLSTLAFWSHNQIQPNMTYDLSNHTCCRLALEQGFCCVPRSVRQLYPGTPALELLEGESYVGIALESSIGVPLGVLCIIDDKPVENTARTESFLRIFSARAAAELERKQATEELQHLNQILEQKVQERTQELEQSYLALSQNMVQLEQAQSDLHQSQQLLADILDHAPMMIFLLDRENQYLFANHKYAEIVSRSKTEIIGRRIEEVWSPDIIQSFLPDIQRVYDEGRLVEYEETIPLEDGPHTFMTKKFPLFDSKGSIYAVCGFCPDITERKRAEEALSQVNQELAIANAELARATRMKDEFLANMSHELRTPLNAILGISESILERVYGSISEKQERALSLIEQSGRHLLALINDILDLAKIEAGKLELHITSVYLEQLCEVSVAFIRQQAHEKQLSLEVLIHSEQEKVMVDELRIRQVLINLLSNAVKFTPTGGKVTLQVTQLPDAIQFIVEDTGIGIDPMHLNQIFQAFVQVDSSLTRCYEGTGLGLALVKRIIDLHQGSIVAESEVGQGSRFIVTLPQL